ncbi:MAG: NosD domain-containing protein [Candidatus Heimdallarchaeota archaeon]
MIAINVIVSRKAVLLVSFFILAGVLLVPLIHYMQDPQGNFLFVKAKQGNDDKAPQFHQWIDQSAKKLPLEIKNLEFPSRPHLMTPYASLLQTYTPHAPIVITSNDAFMSLGFPGAGTAADPYRIDGWNISTSGVPGIAIVNTAAHFIISNCWVNTNSTNNGIYLSNLAEGTATITNNIITNSDIGIRLQDSSYHTISHNNVTQAHASAIHLNAAHGNTLTWNNVSVNQENGFLLERSSSNTITRNIMSSNGRYGVNLAAWSSTGNTDFESSNFNIIEWNAFIGNNGGFSQAYDTGEENFFSHNFWDDWTIDDHPDADGNGFIDDPYRIIKLSNNRPYSAETNLDLYPLASFSRLVDSDGDGMDDYWESLMGLDPASNDTAEDLDGDGITNWGEYELGTAPNNPDTDADGLRDGAEVNTYGTDPRIPDTDGDGLADGVEVNMYGSSPLLVDSDADGLADGVEVNTYHTNPAKADTDGDSLADGAEVIEHHTDPTDADSDGDFFPDGLDYGLWGNPNKIWDNLLTRGLAIGLLLGLGVLGCFAVYQVPRKRSQEMQRQLQELKQQTRQLQELLIENREQLAACTDPAELELTARKAYEHYTTCKEAIETARRHAASRWLSVFRQRNLATLKGHTASVNQVYTQFTQEYLKCVEEFIFD